MTWSKPGHHLSPPAACPTDTARRLHRRHPVRHGDRSRSLADFDRRIAVSDHVSRRRRRDRHRSCSLDRGPLPTTGRHRPPPARPTTGDSPAPSRQVANARDSSLRPQVGASHTAHRSLLLPSISGSTAEDRARSTASGYVAGNGTTCLRPGRRGSTDVHLPPCGRTGRLKIPPSRCQSGYGAKAKTLSVSDRKLFVSGLIDSTLDELDQQVRELKRELAMVEELRRQLSPTQDDPPGRGTPASSRTR